MDDRRHQLPRFGILEHRIADDDDEVAFITSAEDLRNPRIIGRAVGVPSYAALATATSEEAWAAIREERELNGPGPFQFVKKDIP